MIWGNQNLIPMQSFRPAVGKKTVFHRTCIMVHPSIAVKAMRGSLAARARGALR